jgi:hypothetical protein
MTLTPKKSAKSPRWQRVRFLITLVAAAFLIAVVVNLVTGCGSTHNGGSTHATKPASTAHRLSRESPYCKTARNDLREEKPGGPYVKEEKEMIREGCAVNWAAHQREFSPAAQAKKAENYAAEIPAREEAVKHEAEAIRRVKQAEGQIKELCSLTLHQVIVGMAGINPAKSSVEVQAEYETLCGK